MPGFDRRGPMGQGPLTGRRMGCCTKYSSNRERSAENSNDSRSEDTTANVPPGSGFGRGRAGRGPGRRNRFRGGF